MNQADARLRVWERLRATAMNDVSLGEWVFDEADDEPTQRRLLKACKQVAKSVDRIVAKTRARRQRSTLKCRTPR
jgi:hypothetical protein